MKEKKNVSRNNEEDKIAKNETLSNKKSKNTNKKHINYYVRLFVKIIIVLILTILSIYFYKSAFLYNEGNIVNYQSVGLVDYKVYLKDNNFYESEYLESGNIYIASLIKRIDLDFDYKFNITNSKNIDYKYSITAVLSIKESNKEKTYFKKEYTLLNDKNIHMENTSAFSINENISIDYSKYNDLANSFKSQYGLSAVSNLTIFLNIDYNLNSEEFTPKSEKVSVEIPLSEKAINIKFDDNNLVNKDIIIEEENYELIKKENIVFMIIMILIALVFVFKIIKMINKLIPKKSKYDKYVNKLLVEYDRFIANTTYLPDFNKYEIIKIENFNELLDIRDNIKRPIMYYNVSNHHKCHFYINIEKTLYLVTIKAIDLENNK